jgi:hypothetical protein
VLLLLKMHTHNTRGNKGQCVIFLFLIDKQPHVLMHNSFCSVALSKLFCGHKKSYIGNSLDVRAFLYVRAGVGRNLRHASVFTHGDDDDVEESKANTQRQE